MPSSDCYHSLPETVSLSSIDHIQIELSTYEWTHHLPLSLKASVIKQQQLALEASAKQNDYFIDGKCDFKPGFSPKDLILLTFVETIIQQPEVGDELWNRVKSEFSDREIVEIISLQGFYYSFSRLTTVFRCDFDEWAKSKLRLFFSEKKRIVPLNREHMLRRVVEVTSLNVVPKNLLTVD